MSSQAARGPPAGCGVACRRRQQQQRATSRHVKWLMDLSQCAASHHTAPVRCPQVCPGCAALMDRIAVLESALGLSSGKGEVGEHIPAGTPHQAGSALPVKTEVASSATDMATDSAQELPAPLAWPVCPPRLPGPEEEIATKAEPLKSEGAPLQVKEEACEDDERLDQGGPGEGQERHYRMHKSPRASARGLR